jgi:hypothetical protein
MNDDAKNALISYRMERAAESIDLFQKSQSSFCYLTAQAFETVLLKEV